MRKKILFGAEARKSVLVGVNAIADAVSVTLGADGRCVLIGESYQHEYNIYNLPTRVTKDGISVAKKVELDDPIENRGVLLMREASQKTMEQSGDGTTTTIVLARAIVAEGIKLLDAGANPMQLKRGIEKSVEQIISYLKENAIPVGDDIEKIRQVATVSANNDAFIGDLIADAFKKIGKDGAIDIEEGAGAETTVKVSDGFKAERGFILPSFANNVGKNKCELIEPYILLYDKNISTLKQIKVAVELCVEQRKPLLIICEDMDGTALHFLNVHVAQNTFPSCVVRTPYFGDMQKQALADIATATGAKVISDLNGIDIEKVKLVHLGKAAKVVITKDETIIIGGEKDEKQYDDLISELKMYIASEKDEVVKAKIEKRVARLTGGVAVISVGGATEVEMKERKDRIDDAVRATKAAVSEGIIVGGGTAFFRSKLTAKEGTDEDKVFDLMCIVKETPLKQLCLNSGLDFKKISEEISSHKSKDVGYNAKTEKVEDLMKAGIIDPVKVLRNAIINASSVATSLLTSECIIVDQQ